MLYSVDIAVGMKYQNRLSAKSFIFLLQIVYISIKREISDQVKRKKIHTPIPR